MSGFVGWENSGPLAEEARNPRRAIPRTVFSAIAIITAVYFLASWAAAAGFIDWKGVSGGAKALGNVASAAPFLDLANHFTPWWAWAVGLIALTSSLGCYVAAATSQTRITYNGAREGLLPPVMARTTKGQAPTFAVGIYVGLPGLLVVVPYFWLSHSAVTVFSDGAGVGTVPILLDYLIANLALPVYMFRAR
ncbi:MAG: amino acid permease, partial [Acidimicrobiales bacterium]